LNGLLFQQVVVALPEIKKLSSHLRNLTFYRCCYVSSVIVKAAENKRMTKARNILKKFGKPYSLMIGAVVGGIVALMEEGIKDHRYGRWVNNNFADYHVPVHADVPPVEVLFVTPDKILS
jgi:hypothetical protein